MLFLHKAHMYTSREVDYSPVTYRKSPHRVPYATFEEPEAFMYECPRSTGAFFVEQITEETSQNAPVDGGHSYNWRTKTSPLNRQPSLRNRLISGISVRRMVYWIPMILLVTSVSMVTYFILGSFLFDESWSLSQKSNGGHSKEANVERLLLTAANSEELCHMDPTAQVIAISAPRHPRLLWSPEIVERTDMQLIELRSSPLCNENRTVLSMAQRIVVAYSPNDPNSNQRKPEIRETLIATGNLGYCIQHQLLIYSAKDIGITFSCTKTKLLP